MHLHALWKETRRFDWVENLSDEQKELMRQMREKGKELATFILENVPSSADKSAAIRSLRLAIVQANMAVVYDWYPEPD